MRLPGRLRLPGEVPGGYLTAFASGLAVLAAMLGYGAFRAVVAPEAPWAAKVLMVGSCVVLAGLLLRLVVAAALEIWRAERSRP